MQGLPDVTHILKHVFDYGRLDRLQHRVHLFVRLLEADGLSRETCRELLDSKALKRTLLDQLGPFALLLPNELLCLLIVVAHLVLQSDEVVLHLGHFVAQLRDHFFELIVFSVKLFRVLGRC